MKVTHLCLLSRFTDGLTYQDNMLSRYHALMGLDVDVIASTERYVKGVIVDNHQPEEYIDESSVRIIRLDLKKPYFINRIFKRYSGLLAALESTSPDILFIHGPQFMDTSVVVKYLRAHTNVRVYVDNHADYSNSATNWFSKRILHRIIWRYCARRLQPYVTKFWGVMPARVDFLIENYGLDRNKCGLLVMGADDDEVARSSTTKVRAKTRARLGIASNELLVVTGGKIDSAKWQTLLLMSAVKGLANAGIRVKLLVFGPVVPELEREFNGRVDNDVVMHVAWASASESYDFFSAADIVCFPGRHSVYWEQAVAMGKPVVVKWWEGTTHVDVCGNAVFLREDTEEEMETVIKSFANDTEYRQNIEERAKSASYRFKYSDIAKKSIEIA